MRDVILKMSTSLDAFVAGPNGELDWLFAHHDEAAAAWTADFLSTAGLHIMGSRTFADMAAWWPNAKDAFAAAMNPIPKAVFSRRPDYSPTETGKTTEALEGARLSRGQPETDVGAAVTYGWTTPYIANGSLAGEIAKLKAQPGKPIVAHGGAGFARSLIAADLVDEFRLIVHPIVLGAGLPIFSGLTAHRNLKLVEAISFPSGVIAMIYRSR